MMRAAEITPQEIREYRERTGAGMMEAKRFLQARADLEFLEGLRHAPIEDKVNWLIEQKIMEAERICKTVGGHSLLTFP